MWTLNFSIRVNECCTQLVSFYHRVGKFSIIFQRKHFTQNHLRTDSIPFTMETWPTPCKICIEKSNWRIFCDFFLYTSFPFTFFSLFPIINRIKITPLKTINSMQLEHNFFYLFKRVSTLALIFVLLWVSGLIKSPIFFNLKLHIFYKVGHLNLIISLEW